MDYQIFQPHADLAPFIKCYWTLDSPKQDNPQAQTIVPDGCMEMIFHYGDLYNQYIDGKAVIQPRSCVFGQLTQPLQIEPTGITGIFSVRFHHDGFMPFATLPIKEMDDKAVSLEKLFGTDGVELEQKVLLAQNIQEKINVVEAFLLERINAEAVDRILQSTIDLLLTMNGQIPVNQISEQTKMSKRKLERKFASSIGLSPKQLSKIIRLQKVLKLLLNKEYTTLTALAHESEYYDQAHFIKDFKEFTGLTPREFYGDHLQMSSLFYRINP
ncbi:AraC family transcriptional regulator [Chryseobacterium lactis]|uniref:AraC family transcriptional regulator n=1 Tax=Chryseobacterium lactis TaxID=1241981 RepID=A0A3G6RH65_CHRLC|nr:helix-turn-helix domain-containing protein [Chryseobacterium lactis]AZA83750.1 AraC family transcriptional regulator [Chryseobacterium lactis]AZB04135.1 AraC family transcriptional regulator [Chryseobacterium lactis]PNW12956.1 AraC family transcriptional regulator [Chryseobacterium lactis]